MNDNSKYIDFFENIIHEIDSKSIHPIQVQSIDEFFKIYTFLTESIKVNKDFSQYDSPSINDFIEFIVLLWFFKCLNERLCINSTLRIKN